MIPKRFHRFEIKYPLSTLLLRDIEYELARMRITPDPSGEYTVSTLFFDTPSLEDYAEKVGGFSKRMKVRVRSYEGGLPGPKMMWVELKEKYNLQVLKQRVGLYPSEWQDLNDRWKWNQRLRERLTPQECDTLQTILYYIHYGGRRPHLLVQYRRKPYIWRDPFGNLVRITIDDKIRACKSRAIDKPTNFSQVSPGKGVLELKFSSKLPFWTKWLISKFQLSRDAYSKYALSVETLHRFQPIPR